jgi:hypothetical protein
MIQKGIAKALCLIVVLGATSLNSMDGTVSRKLKTKTLEFTDAVYTNMNRRGFRTAIELATLLLVVVPFVYYLTDGKNFDNASSDENLQDAIETLKENMKSLAAYTTVAKEVWFKVIRTLRSATGHRSYKISVLEQTITNADGSTSTSKQEQTVPATGLCKQVETIVTATFPFLINSGVAIVGFEELARILETGTWRNLKDIKKVEFSSK